MCSFGSNFVSSYDISNFYKTIQCVFVLTDYFRLKAIDVVTMRELSKRVNVIPVIAKSDTACKDELVRFKIKVSDIDFFLYF